MRRRSIQRAEDAPAAATAIKQASPDDPSPPDQGAEDAPAVASATKQASPDNPAGPDQQAEDAPALGPAITQAPPDDSAGSRSGRPRTRAGFRAPDHASAVR